ncbi:phosphate/phosphite/phosphonate ABC transporter substrate-binding protein [Pseudochelatococcus sp. B33]
MFLRKLALATAFIAAAFANAASAAETYRFAVTDIEGLEELQREYTAFRDTLAETTGLQFEFFPVSNRTVAGEALRAEQVEFVLTGPSEYTIYRSRTKVVPVVAFSRPDYFSVVAVRQDSGIRTIADLKGKTIALNDIGSTSGHIGPSLVLAAGGLDPSKDTTGQHLSSEVGYTALKRGDVAALGVSSSNYVRLRDRDPEVNSGTFRVIGRSPDLPNDVLIAGAHVDPAIVEKLKETFRNPETAAKLIKALSATEDGADRYKLSAFLPDVQDSDYEMMRQGYIAIGQPQFAKPVE